MKLDSSLRLAFELYFQKCDGFLLIHYMDFPGWPGSGVSSQGIQRSRADWTVCDLICSMLSAIELLRLELGFI